MKKIFAVLVSLCLLGGCTQQAQPVAASSTVQQESSSSAASSPEAGQEAGRELITGRVSAIDGSSVTIETMANEMRGDRGGRPDGEPPKDARKDGAASETESEAAPQESSTEDESNSESSSRGKRSKERPSGENQPAPRQTEEKTVSIPDGCSIKVVQDNLETDGSISDIVVGSIIRLTMSEDGEAVQSVSILGTMPERGAHEDAPPDENTASDASSEAESESAAA